MSDDESMPGSDTGGAPSKQTPGREHDVEVAGEVLGLLRGVHGRLAGRAERLAGDDLGRRSFCDEWSVAQVYSHLGSGAEIGVRAIEAARQGVAPPDPWQVWNRWDAKDPADMVADFAPADTAYLDALDEAVAALEGGEELLIPIDGRPWPLTLLMTARLVEMALHEWDVAVVQEPDADVDPAAASSALAAFPMAVASQAVAPAVAARLAPLTVGIEVLEPDDRLRLVLLPSGARLERTAHWADPPGAVLTLPDAAAWMRLVSGRWRLGVDDARTQISGELAPEDLCELFPGF